MQVCTSLPKRARKPGPQWASVGPVRHRSRAPETVNRHTPHFASAFSLLKNIHQVYDTLGQNRLEHVCLFGPPCHVPHNSSTGRNDVVGETVSRVLCCIWASEQLRAMPSHVTTCSCISQGKRSTLECVCLDWSASKLAAEAGLARRQLTTHTSTHHLPAWCFATRQVAAARTPRGHLALSWGIRLLSAA